MPESHGIDLGGALGEILDKPTEEAGRLLVSCDNVPVLETITMFGLFAAPQFAKYPYLDVWEHQVVAVLRGPLPIFHVPPPLREFVDPASTECFFVAQACPSRELNFLPHLWVFPGVCDGAKLGYDTDFDVGLFTFEGSGARSVDVNWNTIGWHQIHVHPQAGGMCLSPNNGRISVDGSRVATIWSVTKAPGRTCIALHWLLPPKIPFEETTRLRELLDRDYGAATAALRYFVTGEGSFGTLETRAIPSQRQRKGGKAANTAARRDQRKGGKEDQK